MVSEQITKYCEHSQRNGELLWELDVAFVLWSAVLLEGQDGFRVPVLRDGELILVRPFGRKREAVVWADARRREVSGWGVDSVAMPW